MQQGKCNKKFCEKNCAKERSFFAKLIILLHEPAVHFFIFFCYFFYIPIFKVFKISYITRIKKVFFSSIYLHLLRFSNIS